MRVGVTIRVRVGVTRNLNMFQESNPVMARVWVWVRVAVGIRARVEGGRLISTHVCKAGLSGMQFNEGGRDSRLRSGKTF